MLATSDVPGGVVNILTGTLANTAPTLASHMDVNAIDLTGVAGDAEQATALEVAAAENLKRVRRAPAAEPDWTVEPGIDRMTDVPRDQDRLAPDRGLRVSRRHRQERSLASASPTAARSSTDVLRYDGSSLLKDNTRTPTSLVVRSARRSSAPALAGAFVGTAHNRPSAVGSLAPTTS